MAYENGDQIINYLKNCVEKYKEDPDIFKKLSGLIDTYRKSADWPYSIESVEKSAVEIVGIEIIELTFGVGKYLNDTYMKWDDIPSGFRKEFEYFYYKEADSYNKAWFGRFNPNGYYGIAHTVTHDEKIFLRIMKNNDENLDLEMRKEDIKELISSLENLLKEKVN